MTPRSLGLRVLEQEEWTPREVDLTRPDIARVENGLLGGGHNFALDRMFAEDSPRQAPGTRQAVRRPRQCAKCVIEHALDPGTTRLECAAGQPAASDRSSSASPRSVS